MSFASGANSVYAYKRQTARGTIATATGAKQIRRQEIVMNWDRSKIENPELQSDRQGSMSRGGIGMGDIAWKGPIAPGVQADYWDALVMGAYQSSVTSGALTTVTAAATAPHFTRSAGSWITDGFRKNMVIRCTGWTTTGVANNSRNYLITAISATQLTVIAVDGTAVSAKTAGDSVTFTAPGKYCYTPSTGFLDAYTTWEGWAPDADATGISEVMYDSRIVSASFNLAPNSLLSASVNWKALQRNTWGTAQYFTSPTTPASTDVIATSNGRILVGGAVYGYVTGLDLSVDLKADIPSAVNTTSNPFIATPQINVTGNIKVMWYDQSLDTAFFNETDQDIAICCVNGPGAAAEFINIILPQARLFSNKPNDGLTTRIREYTFDTSRNAAGAAGTIASTIAIQDSLAP